MPTLFFKTTLVLIVSAAISPSFAATIAVNPAKDSTTVLHNPLMGLVGAGWSDPRTLKYANIAKYGVTWSRLEPTEGNYAWDNDPFWIKELKTAKDNGFHVAFRIVLQDTNLMGGKPATPQFVYDAIRAAGQNPITNAPPTRTLIDVNNRIWQQKFQAFITAFGKRFDDPSITDYIDVNGLGGPGSGGEGDWIEELYVDTTKTPHVVYLDWQVGVYDQAFKHVILDNNLGELDATFINRKYELISRRDGMGSQWVDDNEWQYNYMQRVFPSEVMLGEYCYSFNGVQDSLNGWGIDPKIIKFALPGKATLATAIEYALFQDSIYHANTLNLSDFDWFPLFPDKLARLIAFLGYRLRPNLVEYSSEVGFQDSMTLRHIWVNDGVGALVNNNKRWNRKYSVAFALFKNGEATPTKVMIDSTTNPGDFLKGKEISYSTKVLWNVPAGQYQLGVGILDKTRPSDPSLALAIGQTERRSGWYLLGNLTVTNTPKVVENSALISNGKPVFSSPAKGGLSLTNGKFETTDWTFGKDSWAALQLGSGAKKVMSLWSQSVYSSWSDSITKDSRCSEGFPVVTNYEILTSNNSTNGADGDWTTKVSVTHNISSARANLIDFDGASWVKVHITNGSGSLGEIQVFDATDTLPNGLFFLGTSITGISQRQFPQDSSVADLILARKPGIRPAVINGGVVCLTSNEVVSNISKYIAMTSPLRYWAIELGLNDGWGNGSAEVNNYAKNMQTIIDSARAHGIVPIIATPPATDPTRTEGGPWQLDRRYAQVVDSLNNANHLAPGPDFYGYFQSHPNELASNGTHPSQVGSLAMRRMWADAIVASGIYTNANPSSIRHPGHSADRLPFSISQQKGSFTIHSLKTQEFEISTFSLSGQKMTQTTTVIPADQDRTIDLRLQQAPPGVYLVRVQSNVGSETIKFMR